MGGAVSFVSRRDSLTGCGAPVHYIHLLSAQGMVAGKAVAMKSAFIRPLIAVVPTSILHDHLTPEVCYSAGHENPSGLRGVVAFGSRQTLRKADKTLDHLPPNIEILTHFGEGADISRDNQRVAFMAKSSGDAMLIDLKSRIITCLPAMYPLRSFSA